MSLFIPDAISDYLTSFKRLLEDTFKDRINVKQAAYNNSLIPFILEGKYNGLKGQIEIKTKSNSSNRLAFYFQIDSLQLRTKISEGILDIYLFVSNNPNEQIILSKCVPLCKALYSNNYFELKKCITKEVNVMTPSYISIIVLESDIRGNITSGEGVFQYGVMNSGIIIKK